MNNCIFCKIINKELPGDIIFENESVVAFKDINPKASVHILIVPKEHIDSINSENSENAVGGLILAAKNIIKRDNITGYKLVFNVGEGAGQIVNHLHLHLLGGWK